jgi:hypothetical protein
MFKYRFYSQLLPIIIIFLAAFSASCSLFNVKTKSKTPPLLKAENASMPELLAKVNHLARVSSLRAKMDLKFEDNSFAELGIAEKYKSADSEIVVQRPSNISLKVQIPLIKTDIVQMTSDGEKFRVAVLEDGAGGKYKRFVFGSNNADYTKLQEEVTQMDLNGNSEELKKNVNAFSNLRPQHFTEALLVRPTDQNYLYVQSEIFQDEVDASARKKSPTARVIRGYYILDELQRNGEDGSLKISRRFWFDRVGGIRLARQQIFDAEGVIESDIIYGNEGNLSDNPDYRNLPLRIEVTRPKEKYKISLTYQTPESVSIGRPYNREVFVLENRWNLPEVDLDKRIGIQP